MSVTIGSTVVRLQTYLRPLPESLSAPGHHGNPRAGSQSLFNGLAGQRCYRRFPAPVRPVRHRLVSSVQFLR